MTVIGFGASSMAGVGDSQGGFFRRTEAILRDEQSDRQFVNLGVGGDTTRDMLARRGDITRYGEPNIVVMLGCNDVPRERDRRPEIRTTLAEYEQNLQALLPDIKGRFSLFIASFPVCADRTGVGDAVLAQYMETARRVAHAAGYTVWDLFGELRGADLTPYWADDGLHFRDAGHAMIAARLADYLRASPPS